MSTNISPSSSAFIDPLCASKLAPAPVTFLMCPPKLYDVSYVINPWMAGHLHASSQAVAAEQWQHLYNAVTEIAEVVLVEPQPGSPDMVFTANAGLERDGVVVLSSFSHRERQGEEPHFRRWFDEAGYAVFSIPHETPFEGEGDALFAVDGSRLWAGYGLRTLQSSPLTRVSIIWTLVSLHSKTAPSCTTHRHLTRHRSKESKTITYQTNV
jgi:hypothetical protein